MADWDPGKLITDFISSAVSTILSTIADAAAKIIQPFLNAIANTIGVLSAPIVTIFTGFIGTFIVGIVDAVLHSFFPEDFRTKDGWNWLCSTIPNIFFLGVYFIFLVGYFFVTKFTQILLTSLSFLMLMTIFIVPFLPMIYFVHVCIKNSQKIVKKSKSIIIGYINEAIYNIRETKNFFSINFVNILLKIVLIFSYQVFLFMSDIFLSLPIVVDQLSKFGIIPKILINIIIYFPVWWFLYSLYVNRNNVDISNTNDLKTILENLNQNLSVWVSNYGMQFPNSSNIKSLCEKTLSNLNILNVKNLANALLNYAQSSELDGFFGSELKMLCTNKSTELNNVINAASPIDLPNKILNAIDSVVNTFWSAWNWVNRKTVIVIEIIKAK